MQINSWHFKTPEVENNDIWISLIFQSYSPEKRVNGLDETRSSNTDSHQVTSNIQDGPYSRDGRQSDLHLLLNIGTVGKKTII